MLIDFQKPSLDELKLLNKDNKLTSLAFTSFSVILDRVENIDINRKLESLKIFELPTFVKDSRPPDR